MGHHLTADGQFKSDRHPDLPAGKIVLSFKDPHAQLGLWVTALDYRAADPELSEDIVTALANLGSAPLRGFAEDAWAWSLARNHGTNPRWTARVFSSVNDSGTTELHIVGGEGVIIGLRQLIENPVTNRTIVEHALVAGVEAPPRSKDDDGRPDFEGFLLALRGERQWSAMIHSDDKTGQADSDQRALHALAQHVQTVGERLGFLPTRATSEPAGERMSPADKETLAMWEAHDAPLLASNKVEDGSGG